MVMGAPRLPYGRVDAGRSSTTHAGAVVGAGTRRTGGVVAAKARVIGSRTRAGVAAGFRPPVRATVARPELAAAAAGQPVPSEATIKARPLGHPRVGRVAPRVLTASVPLVVEGRSLEATPAVQGAA